jgi:hypothetical protein
VLAGYARAPDRYEAAGRKMQGMIDQMVAGQLEKRIPMRIEVKIGV